MCVCEGGGGGKDKGCVRCADVCVCEGGGEGKDKGYVALENTLDSLPPPRAAFLPLTSVIESSATAARARTTTGGGGSARPRTLANWPQAARSRVTSGVGASAAATEAVPPLSGAGAGASRGVGATASFTRLPSPAPCWDRGLAMLKSEDCAATVASLGGSPARGELTAGALVSRSAVQSTHWRARTRATRQPWTAAAAARRHLRLAEAMPVAARVGLWECLQAGRLLEEGLVGLHLRLHGRPPLACARRRAAGSGVSGAQHHCVGHQREPQAVDHQYDRRQLPHRLVLRLTAHVKGLRAQHGHCNNVRQPGGPRRRGVFLKFRDQQGSQA
jgi:hypothetical protein